MKPTTPLPWKDGPLFQTDSRALFFTDHDKPGTWQRRLDDKGALKEQDARYLAHAANAYPKLVAALQEYVKASHGGDWQNAINGGSALLKELGEWHAEGVF